MSTKALAISVYEQLFVPQWLDRCFVTITVRELELELDSPSTEGLGTIGSIDWYTKYTIDDSVRCESSTTRSCTIAQLNRLRSNLNKLPSVFVTPRKSGCGVARRIEYTYLGRYSSRSVGTTRRPPAALDGAFLFCLTTTLALALAIAIAIAIAIALLRLPYQVHITHSIPTSISNSTTKALTLTRALSSRPSPIGGIDGVKQTPVLVLDTSVHFWLRLNRRSQQNYIVQPQPPTQPLESRVDGVALDCHFSPDFLILGRVTAKRRSFVTGQKQAGQPQIHHLTVHCTPSQGTVDRDNSGGFGDYYQRLGRRIIAARLAYLRSGDTFKHNSLSSLGVEGNERKVRLTLAKIDWIGIHELPQLHLCNATAAFQHHIDLHLMSISSDPSDRPRSLAYAHIFLTLEFDHSDTSF
ncbi:hypothetical protein HYALB_00009078 [Hymenoscyphus albidus]|uniref:Uncharacterized protein n=1 Tax=Hymenoscyphus albidus TaxID=595503 RepID=A0A9N9Q6C9_9HELO|nr:hypothetical protein HYALB_00009078 [Hymenoscyphus albidus]